MTFVQIYNALYESPESDVAEYKETSKQIDFKSNVIDDECYALYRQMMYDITSNKYEYSVELIDKIVKDPKLKFLLSLGYTGKRFPKLNLKMSKIEIPVRKLIPSQNEIDMTDSLKYILQGSDIDNCFNDVVVIKRPIVTFQGRYIIDGHHRWSQIFICNPKAKAYSIDFTGQLSTIDMLKAVQAVIGTTTGNIPSASVSGTNLLGVAKAKVQRYIESNLSRKAYIALKKYVDDPREYLLKNVMELSAIKPLRNAPSREYMPQTSKVPKLFDNMKKGVAMPVRDKKTFKILGVYPGDK